MVTPGAYLTQLADQLCCGLIHVALWWKFTCTVNPNAWKLQTGQLAVTGFLFYLWDI